MARTGDAVQPQCDLRGVVPDLELCHVAVFYLMLGAPFIALAQMTVYAGAIMVLFLFVIMLLGAEQTGRTPAAWWMQPPGMVLGVILLIGVVFIW